VTEPRDPFEDWLHTEVEQLPPPPGTFEQIKKRARRRKVRRAAMSVATAGVAAGVIVLAVVALPNVVPSMLHLNKSHQVPAAASRRRPAHDYGTAASNKASSVPSTPSAPASTGPAPGGTGTGPVPANFAPSSVTFVSLDTGFALGQAGTPGACANANPSICTSMAKTTDAGHTWTGLPAPDTGAPDGSTGVSQIRFINPLTGWAFGPELWVTRDGGHTWAQVPTHGMRVTSLETVGSQAYAVFARCTGTGAAFAATCKHVWLYSSPTGSNDWTPMTGSLGWNNGDVSAKVVLGPGAGGTPQGYFYEPDGMLLTGPASAGATWQPASQQPANCQPLNAQQDGQPAGGQLAATGNGSLALACPGTYGSSQETVYTSANGGQSWQPAATFTVSGTATSLAEGTGGVLTLSTTGGIYTSSDGGQSWSQTAQGVTGGFSYVGLTSPTQGVAVPAEPSLHHAVWFTYNGGQSWQRHPVRNG
jgi:hypothetical protein